MGPRSGARRSTKRPTDFQVWELNEDCMFGIEPEDLAKPATGRQWVQKNAIATASTSFTLQKTGPVSHQN